MPGLDDSVVQLLYQAAAGGALWRSALAALDSVFGTVGSLLVVFDKVDQLFILFEQSEHTPSSAVVAYIQRFWRSDPHVAHLLRQRVGAMFTSADIAFPQSPVSYSFYRDFWRPNNLGQAICAKLADDGRRVALLGLVRSCTSPAYSRRELGLASRYFAHLAAGFLLSDHLRNREIGAAVGRMLVAAVDHPLIVLGSERKIVYTNESARSFIEKGTAVFARDDVLCCRSPHDQRRLQHALQSIARPGESGKPCRDRAAIPMTTSDGQTLLCRLWAMWSEALAGLPGRQPTTLLAVSAARAGREGDPLLLGSLFELTPAETRVAIALARGDELHAIAKAHNVSIETVRTQLKSIYTKTNTHRRVQLAELLWRSTAVVSVPAPTA